MSSRYLTLSEALPAFLEYLQVRQFSEGLVYSRQRDLRRFIGWCGDRGITRVDEVTRPVVERYQRWLFHYRKKNGKPLGVSTQHGRLCSVKMFFKWAARQHHVMNNPAGELELPRKPLRLPQDVLTPREAEQVLSQPDVSHGLGVRDRVMLEVLYSTGIRRTELARLKVHDVNHENGTVMVREGKGKKDRVVPIGERALGWVRKYLDEVRPKLVLEPDPEVLFLSATGEVFHPDNLTRLVREYVEGAEIGKRGSCHLFRHTMATAMLERGADIRFIQAILGHSSLETTTVYTRVSIAKLKEVHTLTHPAGCPTKAAAAEVEDEASEEDLLEELAADASEEVSAE